MLVWVTFPSLLTSQWTKGSTPFSSPLWVPFLIHLLLQVFSISTFALSAFQLRDSKACYEDWTLAWRTTDHFLLWCSFENRKIGLVKELMGKKINWNHTNTPCDIWSGQSKQSSFPFSVISHNAYIAHHFYFHPFSLRWENITNTASVVSILLFNMLKAI